MSRPPEFPCFQVLHTLFPQVESFWVLFCIASHVSTRAASSLPDGDYDVTPRVEQTDAQLNQAEAAQELTLY
jgi:hypothetical protein